MTEITIRLQTNKSEIESGFFESLNNLAKQYDICVKNEKETFDSAQMVREDRDWHDKRDEERAAQSKGLQKDLSHLDKMKG